MTFKSIRVWLSWQLICWNPTSLEEHQRKQIILGFLAPSEQNQMHIHSLNFDISPKVKNFNKIMQLNIPSIKDDRRKKINEEKIFTEH